MRRCWEWRSVQPPSLRFGQRRRAASMAAHPPSPSPSPSIQTLYELCKKSFSATGAAQASPLAVRKLCSHLDTMVPSDVGLKEFSEDDRGHGFFGNLFKSHPSNRAAGQAQPITYLHIHECQSFTIGIFCMPTSSVIPLHDHPGMTVLSKVLYGSMHVKGFDWVDFSPMQSGNSESLPVKLAKLQVDTILTAPCPTTVLYPNSGGNLHCFTAITPCAVLDVLAPPYSEAFGRICTYYRNYPFSSFAAVGGLDIAEVGDDYAWLQEIKPPDDLYIRSGRYAGPTVRT